MGRKRTTWAGGGGPDALLSENFPGSGYTPHEAAALRAVDAYRRKTGRKFTSVTEVMQILISLGWTPPPEGK